MRYGIVTDLNYKHLHHVEEKGSRNHAFHRVVRFGCAGILMQSWYRMSQQLSFAY